MRVIIGPACAAILSLQVLWPGGTTALMQPRPCHAFQRASQGASIRLPTHLNYKDDGPSVSSSDSSPFQPSQNPHHRSQQASGDNDANPFYRVLRNTQEWIEDHSKDEPHVSDSGVVPAMSSILLQDSKCGNKLSFICETSDDPAIIVANIFRKLKEARTFGEEYGTAENPEEDGSPRPPMKQTQVYVVPTNAELSNSFPMFDRLMDSITDARKHSQEYVTDQKLSKHSRHLYGISDEDFSVSVNCAHMHPTYGESEDGRIMLSPDAKLYEGRQSPYPTIVVEVISQPYDVGIKTKHSDSSLMPFMSSLPDTESPLHSKELYPLLSNESVEYAKQLHLTFTKSSVYAHNKEGLDGTRSDQAPPPSSMSKDGTGDTSSTNSIRSTEMMACQRWMADHDPNWDVESSSFCVSTAQFADEAYEFVFASLAAQTSHFVNVPPAHIAANTQSRAFQRLYLIMPDFISCSASSFIRFGLQVQEILSSLPPSIADHVHLELFHPESVKATQQSPYPVFVLNWK